MSVRAAVTATSSVVVALALLTACSSVDRVPDGHASDLTAAPTPVPSAFSTAVPVQGAALPPTAAPPAPPTRLTVDWAGVDVPVHPEGVDPTGAMTLPDDPATAGWYRFGPTPASATGSTVIAAHVDAVGYGIGPFAHLIDVPDGTAVSVTDADGDVSDYVVDSVQMLAKTSVPWGSVFDSTGPRRLVLVTCGGVFDTSTHHYESNLVVTATPAVP
ncbi:class F sortase [Curtobacterium sp. Leaf261]|uniref:class F sortase n=1 Tax=Curtobacterium sp. Leaf261 TaxID=1736311 RepID=UPI0006FE4CA1|nr:class F sortase [Curtobacterium sp. Leaf261]KQO63429.1 hypothetical protein ASF23_03985 [Curtobacterium sp. Leaf261]